MPAKPGIYSALEGQYVLHQTLGTGGFAKVKRATHILTGENVAIKIMDKLALGDDLPRVQLEIEALKVLNHPNICKLYQVIETEKTYFLVLEYCPGGELFDYIIERDRVTEKEAQVFFRQIVSAVAFIHAKGYAHRDLKPENLLLDSEHNLKLIDFGLCAKPKSGMKQQLETCCGSPAYAAPELITGDCYNGNKVDIWSMGVLLYALLCGFLPFDDENFAKLYKKIQKGKYFCPLWLSDESKSILSAMLQTDPERRISIEQLQMHPWLVRDGDLNKIRSSPKQFEEYDPDCLAELAVYYKQPLRAVEISLNQCKFDYLSASYFLLLSKKRSGKPYSLNHSKGVLRDTTFRQNLSGIMDTSPLSKMSSLDSLMNSDLLWLGSPKKGSDAPSYTSSKRSSPLVKSKQSSDKENFVLPPLPARKSKKSAPKLNSCDNYELRSPKTLGFSASLDTAVNEVGDYTTTINMLTSDKRAQSFESPTYNITTPKRRPPRPMGSSAKKVFGSIEKGLDSVRNFLTPKKRMCGMKAPRQIKNLCNVSATNDKVTADEVLESLQNALLRKGIQCKLQGYILRGKICENKSIRLRFELEVCQLPNHQHAIGVRRKRLQGDAWHYKKVCEEVLRLALLDTSVATTDV